MVIVREFLGKALACFRPEYPDFGTNVVGYGTAGFVVLCFHSLLNKLCVGLDNSLGILQVFYDAGA